MKKTPNTEIKAKVVSVNTKVSSMSTSRLLLPTESVVFTEDSSFPPSVSLFTEVISFKNLPFELHILKI